MTSIDTPDIPREFPKLDYIERCYIANLVNKVGGIDSSGMSKGTLLHCKRGGSNQQ